MTNSNIAKNQAQPVELDDEPTSIVTMLSPTKISLRIKMPRPGGRNVVVIDFADFGLPETPFTHGPTTVASRPDLVRAIVAFIDSYISRNGHGNQSHRLIKKMVKTLCKFFEYLWLNGCYRLRDCRKQLTDQLPAELARGGWAAALKIRERTQIFVENNSEDKLRKLIGRIYECETIRMNDKVVHALGTNLEMTERSEIRVIVLNALGFPPEETAEATRRKRPGEINGVSAGFIHSELNTINRLADDPEAPALRYTPFPYAYRTANKLGNPKGRTESMRPEAVGAWLRESFGAIDKTSGPLLQFLEEIYKEFAKQYSIRSGNLSYKKRYEILAKALTESSLSNSLGMKVLPKFFRVTGNAEETTVGQLIRDLMSSCFVVIAALNGRRKEEIQSPSIGLTNRSLKTIDADLGVFECDFYIEKTHRCYVPFFVGDATVRAIRILDQLSELAYKFAKLGQEDALSSSEQEQIRSLFMVPVVWAAKKNAAGHWFDFRTSEKGYAQNLAALCQHGQNLPVRAHMFRRAYALIFHYRYEDGDLLALKQQLGHFDIEMTLIYVTWAAYRSIGDASVSAYGRLTPEQLGALKDHVGDLIEHIEQVSKERLRYFVEEILEGKTRLSGGFPRLIQRFHQRFGATLDYRLKASNDQVDEIIRFLEHRGHAVVPFPHGNCVAARGKPNRGAGCFEKATNQINRQDASPKTCARCPYHVLSRAHLNLMEQDAARIEAKMPQVIEQTVAALSERATLQNLQRWIALHRARLDIES